VVGIPTALSYNSLSEWKVVGNLVFFDAADLLASNYLLPLSGLMTAIYVGWFWSGKEEKQQLLAGGAGWVYPVWHLLIRYVSPLAVAVVLYFKVRETGLLAWLFPGL